jgi:hypothetical protein
LEHSYEFFELIRWVVFVEDDDVPAGGSPLQTFNPKNPGIPPTSVNNEKKAWKYLKQYCELKIMVFPTKLEEDEALLEKESGFIERNILRNKICDKKIYKFWIEMADIYLGFCEMTRKEAEQEFVKLNNKRAGH